MTYGKFKNLGLISRGACVSSLMSITQEEVEKLSDILNVEEQHPSMENCDCSHMSRQQRRKMERNKNKKTHML